MVKFSANSAPLTTAAVTSSPASTGTRNSLSKPHPSLAATFQLIAEALTANKSKIVAELLAVQGQKADVGGY